MVATASLVEEQRLQETLRRLRDLRHFNGPPKQFWPALSAALGRLADASVCLLVRRDPQDASRLLSLGEWCKEGAGLLVDALQPLLPELTTATLEQGSWIGTLDSRVGELNPARVLGLRLVLPRAQGECVAALVIEGADEQAIRESLIRLQLAADLPAAFETLGALQIARRTVRKLSTVLDLATSVDAETRFRAAALAFCNGVASQLRCERVSLGWVRDSFVHIKAISRTENFDRRMVAVRAIEDAMEEALDQDEEVVWPGRENACLVVRAHQHLAVEHGSPQVVSLPLRLDQRVVAVMTCERPDTAFAAPEVDELRLACDLVSRRLGDLERTDHWIGARCMRGLKEAAARLVGPEHTWAKAGVVVGAALLLALLLPVYPYRVEGTFVLRSEEVVYLTTPFDGYIQRVEARPGDTLAANDLLLALNTDELVLEEATAIAEHTRYLREVEKARATRALAEMRIAQARADEAGARLALVQHRLARAELRSPFPGVVAEGNLRERIGAPVRQGDPLFKVARLDTLYVEAEINERDIHEVLGLATGEIAFLARPRVKFPVRVEAVEPAAVAKEQENVFTVRCAIAGPVESWWRPGMRGVCKLPVGRRTLLWIVTHRTVDFLRMFLWW